MTDKEIEVNADITPISEEQDCFCEDCGVIFQEEEEYWWVKIEEEDRETDERYCLCDDCYRNLLENRGDVYVKEIGGNGD